jgi:hypothetical protein
MAKTKYEPRFNAKAVKKLVKDSEQIYVVANDDGSAWIVNGYWAFRLSADEYETMVRPVTRRDIGNFKYVKSANECREDRFDIEHCIATVAQATAGEWLRQLPILFAHTGGYINAFWDAKARTPHYINNLYVQPFASYITFMGTKSSIQPILALDRDELIAIIMPVRPNEIWTRAVEAMAAE